MSIGKAFRALFKSSTQESIIIDGRSFKGRAVTIINDKVIIDGVEQDGSLSGPVNVTLHGDVELIDGPIAEVTVTGSARNIKTMSGSVRCGDVTGDIGTMSGDVTCGKVGGSIKTMSGNIRTS